MKTNGVVVGVSSNVNDAAGNVTWHRDFLGNQRQASYDGNGNLIQTIEGTRDPVTRWYDTAGHLWQWTDGNFGAIQWTYDANSGFNTAVSFPDSTSITKTPDNIGRVATVTDPVGYQVQYAYDDLDRVTQVAFPDSTTIVNTYSCCGLEWTEDRLGRRTYFGYDAIGRRNSISNAAGQVLRFDYHPSGQISAIRQAMGGYDKVTQFNYTSANGFSRLTSRVAPSGKTSNVYGYNFRGWLTSRTDALQRHTGYGYDGLGRLTRITYPDAGTVTMGYDVLGRVTNAATAYASQGYTYDEMGEVTAANVTLNVPGFSTVAYSVFTTSRTG